MEAVSPPVAVNVAGAAGSEMRPSLRRDYSCACAALGLLGLLFVLVPFLRDSLTSMLVVSIRVSII